VTQDEAFLQAIWEDLSDDTPWLIYADWLEERGDPRSELYRHRRLTNSIGTPLVLIPPGKFLMGSPETEAQRSENEGPQHEVEITRPFYLGAYPVTQEEYEKVMGKNPSWFSARGGGKGKVKGLDTRRFPVENVSWEDAVEFCRLLTEKERGSGRLYRLPTEAEWEYSCRGGQFYKDSVPFCLAAPSASLSSQQANFDGNYPYGGAAKGPYLERTATVGSYQPNVLGLYDLHGNVWEWCQDWYGPYPDNKEAVRDPDGPPKASVRVLRGGSWGFDGRSCRSAYRNGDTPDYRALSIGFRLAAVPTVGAQSGQARGGA
jgi:uncharacterized protein (TIGR02996 family)